MSSGEALGAALSLIRYPRLALRARKTPLPKGITLLLEVAAGQEEALVEARSLTGQTDKDLKEAAGFFVEQVLLSKATDYYRVLGCDRKDSPVLLRRHMALIMKWLHPDVVSDDCTAAGFDRSLYASHVTKAWDALKTEERREAYDIRLDARAEKTASPAGRKEPLRLPSNVAEAAQRKHWIKPYRVPTRREGFWTRIFYQLAGRS